MQSTNHNGKQNPPPYTLPISQQQRTSVMKNFTCLGNLCTNYEPLQHHTCKCCIPIPGTASSNIQMVESIPVSMQIIIYSFYC